MKSFHIQNKHDDQLTRSLNTNEVFTDQGDKKNLYFMNIVHKDEKELTRLEPDVH